MDRVVIWKLNQMTRYINTRRYWHSSCKSNVLNLLLSPPCFALLITGGELEQIFGNIHPTFANFKVSSGIWISPLKNITVWSRCRFQISTKWDAPRSLRKRVFVGLNPYPAHAFLSTHARTCGGYPCRSFYGYMRYSLRSSPSAIHQMRTRS